MVSLGHKPVPLHIEQVEASLGLTEKDIEALKGVRLVWQKLQKLRQNALKDEKFTKQYTDLLAKSLAQARAQMPAEDEDSVIRLSQGFWEWYDAQCCEHHVGDLESKRGGSHLAWCEKWLPTLYKDYDFAIQQFINNPSQQQLDRLKVKSKLLLEAYVSAFK
jgi:hypothetical protein